MSDETQDSIPQQDLPPYERDGYEVLEEFNSSNPATADALVLQHLRQMGADLSKSRHIIHYFYFPTEETRARAEIRLRASGYGTRFGVEVPGDTPWSLIADRTGVVDEKKISDERLIFADIVNQEDGDYEGWEAQLD